MKLMLSIVGVVLLVAVIGLVADGTLTAMIGRPTPSKLYALPSCKNDGCGWGPALFAQLDGKNFVAYSSDFSFAKCHTPAPRCYPEHTSLYPYAYKGASLGEIYCEKGRWVINQYTFSVPCPPELASLDGH